MDLFDDVTLFQSLFQQNIPSTLGYHTEFSKYAKFHRKLSQTPGNMGLTFTN